MPTIYDLPIWEDCPYKHPKELEIRRGKSYDQDMIAIWNAKSQKHIDIEFDNLTKEQFREACKILTGHKDWSY